jgi:hypothetical protein
VIGYRKAPGWSRLQGSSNRFDGRQEIQGLQDAGNLRAVGCAQRPGWSRHGHMQALWGASQIDLRGNRLLRGLYPAAFRAALAGDKAGS